MSDNKKSQHFAWEDMDINTIGNNKKSSFDDTFASSFGDSDFFDESAYNRYCDIFAGSSDRSDDFVYSFDNDNYIYDPKLSGAKKAQNAKPNQNKSNSAQRKTPQSKPNSSANSKNARSAQKPSSASNKSTTKNTSKKKKKKSFLSTLFSKNRKKPKSQKAKNLQQKNSQNIQNQHRPTQGGNSLNNQQPRNTAQRTQPQGTHPQRNQSVRSGAQPKSTGNQPSNRQHLNPNDIKKQQKRIEKLNNDYSNAVRNGNKSANEARALSAQKKRKSNKVHIFVIVACVVLVIAASVLTFCFVKGFPIENISVEGNSVYTSDEILKAANINVSDNILRVRQRKTNNTLKVALPYIESVTVNYELPDTLKLEITETKDKMYLVIENKYLCLDQNSKILSTTKKKLTDNKYKIIGLKQQEYEVGYTFQPSKDNGNAEKYEIALEIIEALESVELTAQAEINLENLDEITVKYTDNILMKFNKDTNAKKQLKIIKSVVDQKLAAKIKSTFDLRFEKPYGKDGDFE